MGAEDEDLETHYNLGMAFREMGLLEEAISEFQKVAKASERGRPFPLRHAVLHILGLAFMDKGQPSIAAIWYERALHTPDIDPESILALRYDLGRGAGIGGRAGSGAEKFFPGLRDEYRLSRRGRAHRRSSEAGSLTSRPSPGSGLSRTMNRLLSALLVVFCCIMGAILFYLPWTGIWEQNYFLSHFPSLMRILLNLPFAAPSAASGFWIFFSPSP